MNDASMLGRLNHLLEDIFHLLLNISRETTALEVDGWDSLTHTIVLMAVEKEFGVSIPVSESESLQNVGELLDLVLSLGGK